MSQITFNFGPIARTESGGSKDTINIASLPLHVMLNALVASTSANEFVAWLWHDLYKPGFCWQQTNNRLNWNHIPGHGAFAHLVTDFAHRTNSERGFVMTHHFEWKEGGKPLPRFSKLEHQFISDQGDQINLGKEAHHVQLSILSEPAMTVALPRTVIANAFIEVVTKDVAAAIRQAFINDSRVPIERVRFFFDTDSKIKFSSSPTDSEIWAALKDGFDVQPGTEFEMRHLTPVTDPKFEIFATTFTADLTGNPIAPTEMLNNIFSLAEMLTLYQDSRSIIMAVPQPQIYIFDADKIKQETLHVAQKRLSEFGVLTQDGSTDYLTETFNSQIEIRLVPAKASGTKDRSLNEIALRPNELLAACAKNHKAKRCRITGTWFISDLLDAPKGLDDLFSGAFVDTEFVAPSGDVSPLARLYDINSSKSGSGSQAGGTNNASMRGTFAFIAPASRFALDEKSLQAVERPPLDMGGRFSQQLNRITVTTQEFTLFQQISRRVIAELWQQIAPEQAMPLPYLGAIVLTHKSSSQIQNLLKHLRLLFVEIKLKAYPFETIIQPAFETAIEIAVQSKNHNSKHTLLKTSPHTLLLSAKTGVPVLINDKIQSVFSKELFDSVEMLNLVTNNLRHKKKSGKKWISQSDTWIKLILAGSDPVTAVMESAQATVDTKLLPKTLRLESAAFNDAVKFWDEYLRLDDLAQTWQRYQKLKNDASQAFERHPALPLVMQVLKVNAQQGDDDEPSASKPKLKTTRKAKKTR